MNRFRHQNTILSIHQQCIQVEPISNMFRARCIRYKAMWYSLSVSCDRSVVYSGYSGFLHQQYCPPRYSWNIVESGVKHYKPKRDNSPQGNWRIALFYLIHIVTNKPLHNVMGTFFLLSLCRHHCWWTISTRMHYPPSGQCIGSLVYLHIKILQRYLVAVHSFD